MAADVVVPSEFDYQHCGMFLISVAYALTACDHGDARQLDHECTCGSEWNGFGPTAIK